MPMYLKKKQKKHTCIVILFASFDFFTVDKIRRSLMKKRKTHFQSVRYFNFITISYCNNKEATGKVSHHFTYTKNDLVMDNGLKLREYIKFRNGSTTSRLHKKILLASSTRLQFVKGRPISTKKISGEIALGHA